MPSAPVAVTVPPVPAGASPWKSYRKILRDLDESRRGAYALQGPFAEPGDRLAVPEGTLIAAVDQRHVRWDTNHDTGERYAVMSAHVTLYLAGGDGELRQLWHRSFAQAKSAAGPAALTQLRKHLDARPVPSGEITVLNEGPGIPNLEETPCAWCGTAVRKEQGRVRGRSDTARVTHVPGQCPPQSIADGTPCERCGITMASKHGDRRVIIDQPGRARWITAHHDYLNCTRSTLLSWEEIQDDIAAAEELQRSRREQAAAAAKRRETAAARRAARKREKEKAARAAAEAEQSRAATLARTARQTVSLNDKGLGAGWRARLEECADTLSDGTTTTCWTVTAYPGTALAGPSGEGEGDWLPDGGSDDTYWYLPDARRAYRELRWSPDGPVAPPRFRPQQRTSSGPGCPGTDVEHCDHCGADTPEPGGWMSASLGRACGTDCFDAMADAEGAHARRYH